MTPILAPPLPARVLLAPWWPMLLALATLALFTFARFYDLLWSHGENDHAIPALAAAAWVGYRERHAILAAARPGSPWLSGALLVFSLAFYVVGRSQDIAFFEACGLVGACVAALWALGGWPGLRRAWLVLVLLALFAPYPAFVVDALTGQLKEFISYTTVELLHALGYPIARDGVVIVVGAYQLLVADACSGLNSIFSLTTVCLLYIYIAGHTGTVRNLLLVASILPIAVLANVARVAALVLLTYHFGHDAGQGYAHTMAHVVLFMTAVAFMVLLDWAFGAVGSWLRPRPSA
jgi:exosortase